MSTLRTPTATSMALALLLPVTGFSQTVIGSWQTGADDGWIDWGNQSVGLFDASNGGKYSIVSNAVAGFAQSLQISQSGWQQNLSIKLQDNAYTGDFLANSLLTFTFSVPGWTNGGYCELFELAINAQDYGFVGQAFDADWSSTGDTNNNDGTKPRFFFSATPQSQTVTYDYSEVLASLSANPDYVEFIFAFNNGGGAPTNFFVNEVVLSSPPSPTLLVHAFDTTNEVNDWWTGWFGEARDEPQVEWDPSDADGDANSGSLKVNGFFPQSFFHDDGTGPQLLVYNDGYFDFLFGTNGMPGYGNGDTNIVATNIAFDLRFDPDVINNVTNGNWPAVAVGARGNLGYEFQPEFGTATVPNTFTNTNWVHFDIAIGPSSEWTEIHGVFFKIWGGAGVNLDGEVDFYVDNIEVSLGEVAGAPTLAPIVEMATPSLRVFAGSVNPTYQRQQLTSVDTNQSWVGTSPVSYSFELLSLPTPPTDGEQTVFRYHIFLVPRSQTAAQGYTGNPYLEYQVADNLWLNVNQTTDTNGVVLVDADVSWKTNTPDANPDHEALRITNSTAVGTWTLTFTSDTEGTLTAPGASPVPFSLPAAAAAHFANPLVAIFGVQPDSGWGIGKYAEVGRIQTIGVAGTPIDTDFSAGDSIDPGVWDPSNSHQPSSSVAVAPEDALWVNWSFPDIGFGLATKAELADTGVPWKSPAFYTGYESNAVFTGQMASSVWALIPENGLPTIDGTTNGSPGNAAFFRLENPPPAE